MKREYLLQAAVFFFLVACILALILLAVTSCASGDEWSEYGESLKKTTCTNYMTGDVIEKKGCTSCPKGYVRIQLGCD